MFRRPRKQNDVVPKDRIERFLPVAPVVIDAGAHRGDDSIDMALRWPGAQVHSFEPVPALYEKLSERMQPFDNIKTWALALGDRNEKTEMYVSSGRSDGSSSLMEPLQHLTVHPEVYFENTVPVRVVTLADWARENGIRQIDFMWLDLQGFEMKALEGAGEMLQGVSAIHAEVSLIETYREVPLYTELRAFLDESGFRVAQEALPWNDMGNVLFVNRTRPGASKRMGRGWRIRRRLRNAISR